MSLRVTKDKLVDMVSSEGSCSTNDYPASPTSFVLEKARAKAIETRQEKFMHQFKGDPRPANQRGASDMNMIVTVLVVALLVSIVISCNRWIKRVNMERRGYIEVPEGEAAE
jgi:hypothetical protein